MRTPIEGEQLNAADGTAWRVKSVFVDADAEADEAYDPDFFLVTLVPLAGARGTEAPSTDLDNTQFDAFCRSHGIRL